MASVSRLRRRPSALDRLYAGRGRRRCWRWPAPPATPTARYPLSEHVVLHLRHGGDAPAVHLLVRDGDDAGRLRPRRHDRRGRGAVGRAGGAPAAPPPRARPGAGARGGRGGADGRPGGRLRLWAHGDHPSASALALSLGFARARVLWQMRRSLFAAAARAACCRRASTCARSGPAQDDEAWLALNAGPSPTTPSRAAGRCDDLRAADGRAVVRPGGLPAGRASGDGALLGFHWTKVHGERTARRRRTTTTRSARSTCSASTRARTGCGLGRALTVAGLRHLRARGPRPGDALRRRVQHRGGRALPAARLRPLVATSTTSRG